MSSCYSEANPVFLPALRIISSISRASQAVVTTTGDHDLLTGEIVRFYIPNGFGMQQLDQQVGTITVTGDTTFTVNIDTKNYDPFALPSPLPSSFTCAQVVPVGEVSSTTNAATQNILRSGARS